MAVPAAVHFVSAVMAVPGYEGLQGWVRRKAVLERTIKILELQGDAEEELLTATLPLSAAERDAALGRHCPVFLLVLVDQDK